MVQYKTVFLLVLISKSDLTFTGISTDVKGLTAGRLRAQVNLGYPVRAWRGRKNKEKRERRGRDMGEEGYREGVQAESVFSFHCVGHSYQILVINTFT